MEQRRRAKSQGCQGGGTLRTTATRGWRRDGWTVEGVGVGVGVDEDEDVDEGATAVVVAERAGDAAAGCGVGGLSEEDAEAMDGARWCGRAVIAMARSGHGARGGGRGSETSGVCRCAYREAGDGGGCTESRVLLTAIWRRRWRCGRRGPAWEQAIGVRKMTSSDLEVGTLVRQRASSGRSSAFQAWHVDVLRPRLAGRQCLHHGRRLGINVQPLSCWSPRDDGPALAARSSSMEWNPNRGHLKQGGVAAHETQSGRSRTYPC